MLGFLLRNAGRQQYSVAALNECNVTTLPHSNDCSRMLMLTEATGRALEGAVCDRATSANHDEDTLILFSVM